MPARPSTPRGVYELAIGDVLREARDSLGMRQRDVAEALGDVTEGMVGFWERGEARVTVVIFMRLAIQAFGMKPVDLLNLVELKLLDQADDKYWQ